MKRTMTICGLLAALPATNELAVASTGDYITFQVDGISNQSFAYRGGAKPAMFMLVGDVVQNYDVVGVAKVHGPDLKFMMAVIDTLENVRPVEGSDTYVLDSSGRDLKLDLDEVLAQLAVAGHGQSEPVVVHTGDQTKFLRGGHGGTNLSVFVIDGHIFGVYQNQGDRLNVVSLESYGDRYLQKRFIATFNRQDIKRSIVDLTATANENPLAASSGEEGHCEAAVA